MGNSVATLLFGAVVACMASHSLAPAFAAAVTAGFEIEQLDFDFLGGVSQPSSTWGSFRVDPAALAAATLIPRGFVNVHVDGVGWVVQNLPVDPADGYGPITTWFDLGLASPMTVASLNVFVDYVAAPDVFSVPGAFQPNVPVGAALYDAQGYGDLAVTEVGRPLPPGALAFDADKKTEVLAEQAALPNIQTQFNQCFPMSIANSLQFLEDQHPGVFNVPHDHKPGGLGDNSLVGQLDAASGRPAGKGVFTKPMLQGKFKYLKDNGLEKSLVQKHQGRGYGNDSQRLPNGDFNFMGIKSDHRGAPSLDFIINELKKGEDVEVGWTYTARVFDPKKQKFVEVPTGGHAVRIVKVEKVAGQVFVTFIHDRDQTRIHPMGKDLETVRVAAGNFDRDQKLEIGGLNRQIDFILSESVKQKQISFEQVPEPSSLTIFAMGASLAAAMAWVRRRRER
jgi:hypothetical protein